MDNSLKDTGVVNTINPGINEARDRENSVKLNYGIQMQMANLEKHNEQQGNRKRSETFQNFKRAVQGSTMFILPTLMLAIYHQKKLAAIAAPFTILYSLRSYENIRKRDLAIRIHESWNQLDPAFREAYISRDSRHIAHYLPRHKTWQDLENETLRRNRLF